MKNEEINKRKEKNERVFVNTITIRMSEEITSYLNERGITAAFLFVGFTVFILVNEVN